MSDGLERLETLGAGLLQQVSPGARAKLAVAIATDLRRSQSRRIKSNANPDGSAYAPRRPQRARKGRIKRGAMFRKLGLAKNLTKSATPAEATVSFVGRVSRIARVHQEGLRDRVRPGGPWADYDQRRLLGFAAADKDAIRDRIIDSLAEGLTR